ncbi:MAG: hypothetical protein ABR555_13005 [Pyrinomonadaceae bacterium]
MKLQRSWAVISLGVVPVDVSTGPLAGPLGLSEIQEAARPFAPSNTLACPNLSAQSKVVRSLANGCQACFSEGSRMSGDVHVRSCESLGVRFLRATHRNIYVRSRERMKKSISNFLGATTAAAGECGKECSGSTVLSGADGSLYSRDKLDAARAPQD